MPRDGHDDNTEKELIELLTRVLTDFFKEDHRSLSAIVTRLLALEKQQEQIMTALETLTASVNANTAGQAELTTAVNKAIVQLGTPGATDAQLLTLAAAVDSSTASDKALTDALNAATTTPTPPTPPPVV